MNIVNALFIYSLTNFFIATAMELVPLLSQQENLSFNTIQINTPQDIPKQLSFETMGFYFRNLSRTKCDTLCATTNDQDLSLLSKSITFNVALLPQELTRKIIYLMLDADKISATIFYKTPLFYAYQRYHQAYEMIKKSSLKNNKPIHLLFRLPSHQQNKIMGPLSPSLIDNIIYDGIKVTKKENEQIVGYPEEIIKEFFTHEKIFVMDDETEKKCSRTVTQTAMFGTLMGTACGCLTMAILLTFHDNKNLALTIGLVIGPSILGCFTGLIGGSIYHGRKALKNSNPIDI